MWNKLPDSFPEIDEFVLWRTEQGNYFVREVGKDDFDWWNGVDRYGRHILPRCTHWAKIHPLDEEFNQDVLWEEAIELLNQEIEYTVDGTCYLHPLVKEILSEKYVITRK